MACETEPLPGIEPRPKDRLRRLKPVEDAHLQIFRRAERAMQRRQEFQFEHILANLPGWQPGVSVNRLHQKLNRGRGGRYTRAEVKKLLGRLEIRRKVRKLENGRWAKC